MQIVKAGTGRAHVRKTETFTGTVRLDPVLPAVEGVAVNHVSFAPNSRTYWHHHEHGQLLHITSGRGLVCRRGADPEPVAAGDVVWTAPGEVHWHGGDAESGMTHLAVSLGTTTWLDEVAQAPVPDES